MAGLSEKRDLGGRSQGQRGGIEVSRSADAGLSSIGARLALLPVWRTLIASLYWRKENKVSIRALLESNWSFGASDFNAPTHFRAALVDTPMMMMRRFSSLLVEFTMRSYIIIG